MFTRHLSATEKGISMHTDLNVDQLAFDVDGVPTPNESSIPSASAITEPSTPPSSSASALDTLLNEIFANEFVLLSYYIASINIEQVYHQVRAEQGVDEGYVEFPGMTLTDTFQLHEGDGTITEDFEGLAANNERAKAEKDPAITVIVMKRSTRQLIQNDGVPEYVLVA